MVISVEADALITHIWELVETVLESVEWRCFDHMYAVEDSSNASLFFSWKSTSVNPACFTSQIISYCVPSDCDYRLPSERTESSRYLLDHLISSMFQSCLHVIFYFPAWSFSASATSIHAYTPFSLDPSSFFCTHLNPLQTLDVLFKIWRPYLDTVLHMGSDVRVVQYMEFFIV